MELKPTATPRHRMSRKLCIVLGLLLVLVGSSLVWPRVETDAQTDATLPGVSDVAAAVALEDEGATYRTPVVANARSQFGPSSVQLCQALSPAAPNPITGVDCIYGNCGERGWDGMGPIDWQAYAQGEYVGHARLPHVPEYRLRVDDSLHVVYRLTRDESARPYQLNVGDEIQVEVRTDERLNRNLIIQPDGTVTMPLIGQVPATRRTVNQLVEELTELYKKFYKPETITNSVTITPVKVNTKLLDIINSVDRRQGFGGQLMEVKGHA